MRCKLPAVWLGLVVALGSAHALSGTSLDKVLELVPKDSADVMISFTDWPQIKDNLGFGFLTSDGPLLFRLELARRVSQDQAAASAYALSFLRTHAETWGWDTADLDWEAHVIAREFPPTYILKLRDDFDFSPVAAAFVERGFAQTESDAALVFTHELDARADWMRTTELSILTTAYIEAEQLMILSAFPAGAETVLAVRAGEIAPLTEDPFACAAVEHLNNPTSAIVLRGLGECVRFTPHPILDLVGAIRADERIAELIALIEEGELLVPYRAVGVGYRQEERRPVGTVVFEYDTPELAAMELPVRSLLAQEAISTHHDAPVSESYFTLVSSDVQQSAVILTVTPVNDQPNRLFRMIFYRDAVFAGCSS